MSLAIVITPLLLFLILLAIGFYYERSSLYPIENFAPMASPPMIPSPITPMIPSSIPSKPPVTPTIYAAPQITTSVPSMIPPAPQTMTSYAAPSIATPPSIYSLPPAPQTMTSYAAPPVAIPPSVLASSPSFIPPTATPSPAAIVHSSNVGYIEAIQQYNYDLLATADTSPSYATITTLITDLQTIVTTCNTAGEKTRANNYQNIMNYLSTLTNYNSGPTSFSQPSRDKWKDFIDLSK